MKMKKRTLSLVSSILVAAFLTACGQGAASSAPASSAATPSQPAAQSQASSAPAADSSADFPEMTINVGHSVATDHGYHKGLEQFKATVEEKTGGKVKGEIHASSSLGSEREMIEALQLGTLEMCLAATSQLTSFVPQYQVFDLPYIFTSRDQAWDTLDGELGEEMLGMLESKGLVGLGFYEVGFRNFTNSINPINTPADISGKKFRTMETPVHVQAIGYWGGNAISMPIGEVYTALQTKTIDGQENPLSIILSQKLYEVQKYISVSEHFYTGTPLLISKTLWDQMTPELQAIIVEAAHGGRDVCRQTNLAAEEAAIGVFEEYGCEINNADKDAFKATAEDIYAMFAGEIGQDLIDKFVAAAENYK